MAKRFQGVINLDIRDSTPDWEPFLAQKAPEDAPNVLVVLCVIGTLGVGVSGVLYLAMGTRSAELLGGLKDWRGQNNAVITRCCAWSSG